MSGTQPFSARRTTYPTVFWCFSLLVIFSLVALSFSASAANWAIDVDLTASGIGHFSEAEMSIETNQDGRPYYRVGDLHILTAPSIRAGFSGNLWSNSRLYYQFSPGVPEIRRQAFRNAIETFSQHTALEFVESSNAGNRIYIIDETNNSNYEACGSSFLGMIGGVQNMRIKCWTTRTIQHEVGHALGLIHEHQRSDRDTYIGVVWSALTPCYNQSTIDVNFGIMSSQNTTSYDFESVMHYPYNVGCGGARAFNPRPGYEAYQFNMGSSSLTDTDLDGLAERYHRKLRVSDQDGSADGLAIRFVSGSSQGGCGTGCKVIANGTELEFVVVGHGRRIPYNSDHPDCHRVSCITTMDDNFELDLDVLNWSPSNPELTLAGLQPDGRYPHQAGIQTSNISRNSTNPELLAGDTIPVVVRTGYDPEINWPQPDECPPEPESGVCLGFLDPYSGELTGLSGIPHSNLVYWVFGLFDDIEENAVITNRDLLSIDNNNENDMYLWNRLTGSFELASWNYEETAPAIEEDQGSMSLWGTSGNSRVFLKVNGADNFLDIPDLPAGKSSFIGYHAGDKRAYLLPELYDQSGVASPEIRGNAWHEQICVTADRRTFDGEHGSVIFTTHAEEYDKNIISMTGSTQRGWSCDFISKSARWIGIFDRTSNGSTSAYSYMLYDTQTQELYSYPLGSGSLNDSSNGSFSAGMDPTERFILFRGRHDSYVSLPRGHNGIDLFLHDRLRNITTIINTANDGVPETGVVYTGSAHSVHSPGFADNAKVIVWQGSKQLLEYEGVLGTGQFVVENPFLAIDEIECGGRCSFDVLFRDEFLEGTE